MAHASRPTPAAVQTLLEEDLEEAYEHGPAGYVSTLPDGTIVRINSTFLAWTGFERDELIGRRRFPDLFHLPGRIYFETHLRPLLALQGTLNEVAIDIACPHGKLLPAILNAAQKRSAGGEALLTRYTVLDATDRRRYERQLLEARRKAEADAQAKTELLAMLSHDIRTPLGSIMAVASLLQRSPLDPEQQGAVRILHSSAASMLELVNQVLERSRLEAGAVSLHPRTFDLRALVRELVSNLEPLALSKGLALRCRVDERLPAAVVGDATKLGQILGNLVGNALKFTESGSVEVALEVLALDMAQVTLRARVRDTGIGIAEEALGRIFEEYGQAHESIAARYGGTGLGLSISRKLLKAQGSVLHVNSRPGEGSEFSFDLTLRLPT
ncbi:MAG TPA: ATP-binding protein [Burkholderiales bacterium]|nr:ATP-binding protein [Burkholderiales bacterium]